MMLASAAMSFQHSVYPWLIVLCSVITMYDSYFMPVQDRLRNVAMSSTSLPALMEAGVSASDDRANSVRLAGEPSSLPAQRALDASDLKVNRTIDATYRKPHDSQISRQ